MRVDDEIKGWKSCLEKNTGTCSSEEGGEESAQVCLDPGSELQQYRTSKEKCEYIVYQVCTWDEQKVHYHQNHMYFEYIINLKIRTGITFGFTRAYRRTDGWVAGILNRMAGSMYLCTGYFTCTILLEISVDFLQYS